MRGKSPETIARYLAHYGASASTLASSVGVTEAEAIKLIESFKSATSEQNMTVKTNSKTVNKTAANSGKGNKYVTGRFDNLKPLKFPVFNHKVEQHIRALVYGDQLFTADKGDLLTTAVDKQTALQIYQDVEHGFAMLPVAISDEYGYRLHPSTASYFIRNGVKPNAVLLAILQSTIEGLPACVESDGLIYLPFVVLQHLAYTIVLSKEGCNKAYSQYVWKFGVPEMFTVQGVYYDQKQEYNIA